MQVNKIIRSRNRRILVSNIRLHRPLVDAYGHRMLIFLAHNIKQLRFSY